MNLPNKLTLSRLVLTVVFVALFYLPITNRISYALLIFAIASITDYLDGSIARSRNLVTNFGKLMDPLADKILMCAALTLLALEDMSSTHDPRIPAWAVVVVMSREFFVTGIRLIAISQGTVLAAEKLGKHKTVWQIATALYFMLWHASTEPMFNWLAPVYRWKLLSPPIFGVFCIFMMTALTLISGFSYFWKNRAMFNDA